MLVVCAWCQETPDHLGPVSHSICETCFKREVSEMKKNDPYEEGKKVQEEGGSWRDNPHTPGTASYYAYEDGRRDAGAKDVGPVDTSK